MSLLTDHFHLCYCYHYFCLKLFLSSLWYSFIITTNSTFSCCYLPYSLTLSVARETATVAKHLLLQNQTWIKISNKCIKGQRCADSNWRAAGNSVKKEKS